LLGLSRIEILIVVVGFFSIVLEEGEEENMQFRNYGKYFDLHRLVMLNDVLRD
jgi:hypothetical protein